MKQANLKSGSKISQIKILEQFKFQLVARLTAIDMLDLAIDKNSMNTQPLNCQKHCAENITVRPVKT